MWCVCVTFLRGALMWNERTVLREENIEVGAESTREVNERRSEVKERRRDK